MRKRLPVLSIAGLIAIASPVLRAHPQPQDAESRGHAAFDRVCKSCHGAEARGDAGPRLVPFSRDYEELLAIVREGSGQMPPISARTLPDAEVGDIVAYLKSLSR